MILLDWTEDGYFPEMLSSIFGIGFDWGAGWTKLVDLGPTGASGIPSWPWSRDFRSRSCENSSFTSHVSNIFSNQRIAGDRLQFIRQILSVQRKSQSWYTLKWLNCSHSVGFRLVNYSNSAMLQKLELLTTFISGVQGSVLILKRYFIDGDRKFYGVLEKKSAT